MKYLIYIGPGIGDWIIAMPMARRIKLNDPYAQITTLTCSNKTRFKLNKSLLILQNWVDNIDYYSVHEPLHDAHMLLKLGIKNYDYYFKSSYFDNSYISSWPNRIMKIAAKKGVGVRLNSKPDFVYDYSISFKPNNNVYDTPMELLGAIGIYEHENEKTTNLLDVTKISIEFDKLGISKEKKIISIVPGTAGAPVTADGRNGTKPAKSWPYEYWNELANKLEGDGYQIVVLGGNAERQDVLKRGYFTNPNIINLCGKTSIMESCAVLCHSILTIGGDTGMMHCSGAVGTPSLTLFGCTDYRNYLAYGEKSYFICSRRECSPCFGSDRLLTCNDFLCMKDISVEEVYNKSISIIKQQAKVKENVDED